MVVSTARALYADTDQMGIVNHAVALRWFEQARAEWLRRLGHSYLQMESEGMLLPVYELQVRYHKPARYDEVVLLDAVLQKAGPVRVIFDYKILHSETKALLCLRTRHECPADLLCVFQDTSLDGFEFTWNWHDYLPW